MTDPKWVAEARRYVGLREVPGPGSSAQIKNMWLSLKGGAAIWDLYRDDSKLAWCGAFLAAIFKAVSIEYPTHYASALAWMQWGDAIKHPSIGCVAIFERGAGKGHVAIVVGQTADGRLLCLGGNQSDMVCIKPFDRKRVVGYRWPSSVPEPNPLYLPMLAYSGASSTAEA